LKKLLLFLLLLPSLSLSQTELRQLGVPFKMRSIATKFTGPSYDTLDVAYFRGSGAFLSGITGATGGIANTGNTTIGADTDVDGVGTLFLQTQGTDRFSISAAGIMAIEAIEMTVDRALKYENYVFLPSNSTPDTIEAHLASNKTFIVPAGTYDSGASDSLVIQNLSKIHFIGAGAGQTVFEGAIPLFVYKVDTAIFEGFDLYSDTGEIAYFDSCDYLIVKNVRFLGSGITKGTGGFFKCDNSLAINVYSEGHRHPVAGHGFEINDCDKFFALACEVVNNSQTGIEIYGSRFSGILFSKSRQNNIGYSLVDYTGNRPPALNNIIALNISYADTTVGVDIADSSSNNIIAFNQIDGGGVNTVAGIRASATNSTDSNLVAYNMIRNVTNKYSSSLFSNNSLIDEEYFSLLSGVGMNNQYNWDMSPSSESSIHSDGIRIKRDLSSTTQWLQLNGATGSGILMATDKNNYGQLELYVSNDTTDRKVFQGYPDGSSAFASKDRDLVSVDTLNIGDWNMDATASVTISHGHTASKILYIMPMIRDDTPTNYRPLDYRQSGYWSINASNITLARIALPDGWFDDPAYDATSYNRGYILIYYIR